MPMTELLDAVDQLTKTHKKAIHTPDGVEFHDHPPLLEQLHDAVFRVGVEATGGSVGVARLPIGEAAADLHTLIESQASEAWYQAHGRVPRMLPVAALVTSWALVVREDTVVTVTVPEQHDDWDEARGRTVTRVIRVREQYTPVNLARHWVAMIADFLNPESTAGIAAACLQCGERKIHRTRDGETIMSDALVFRRDRETGETLDARCLACGMVWPPTKFEFLCQALGIPLDVPEVKGRASQRVEWSGSAACFDGHHDRCVSVICRCDCHTKATAA